MMEQRNGARGLAPLRGSRHALGAVLGAVLALAVAPGCQGQSKNQPVALTVGSREIRVDELERAFWNQEKADKSFQADSASLRRFLPILVDRVIWEELARQAIPQLQGLPQERVDEYREQLLVENLRRESFLDAAEPSDAELKKGYEELGRELHLRSMQLADKKEAEDFLVILRQGGVFAKIAETKSTDERSRKAGGDIGWITYAGVSPEIRDQIWALKPGELAGPLPLGQAWGIFQLVEERPNVGRGTYEAEAPRLRLTILANRARAGSERFVDELLRKYKLNVDPVQVAWMTALLREKTASVPRDIGKFDRDELDDPEVKDQISGNPFKTPPIAPADTGRVLATWDGPGGKVKPYWVIDQLLDDPPLSWPKFENSEDVVKLIREIALERLYLLEAQARKIDQRPDILARIADKENEVRGRYYFRTQIRPAAAMSDSEAHAYYDSHPAEWRQGERRRFVALSAADLDVAREIQTRLQTGAKVSEVKASLLGRDPTLRGTGDRGTEPLAYGDSPLLDPTLFGLPAGGVSGPIPVEGRFTVARVEEIVPARTIPFEEAAKSLREKTAAARADALMKARIDAARPSYPVKVEEAALRKVRLALPKGW